MEKDPQKIRVKHDRPVCERCQDPKIVMNEDGSYKCKRCGFVRTKER